MAAPQQQLKQGARRPLPRHRARVLEGPVARQISFKLQNYPVVARIGNLLPPELRSTRMCNISLSRQDLQRKTRDWLVRQ